MIEIGKATHRVDIFVALTTGLVVGAIVSASIYRSGIGGSYADGVYIDSILMQLNLGKSFLFPPLITFWSLGSVFSVSFGLIPVYWPQIAFGVNGETIAATYFLSAVALSVSTFFLCRALGANTRRSAFTAFFLSLFVYPAASWSQWGGLNTACPIFADTVSYNNLILIFLIKFLSDKAFNARLLFCLAVSIFLFSTSIPRNVILAIPADIAVYLAAAYCNRDREHFWKRQTGLFLSALGLLILLGPYLAGLFLNTSSNVFGAELTGDVFEKTTPYIAIIFGKPIYSVLAMLCFAALATSYRSGDEPAYLRLLLCVGVLAVFLEGLLSANFVFIARGKATFPRPFYFDLCIAPLYVLAVVTAIELTLARAYKHVSADPLNPNYLRGAQIAIVVSAIAFVAVHPENYHPEIYPRVPTADKFVEFLQSKLGGRDKSFKGSVMTYTGNPADAGEMLAYDRTVAQSVGNAHRAQMLWYFDIPTLDEYNDLMTPAKYVFLTRMFANRYEHQSRNLLVLNRIHPPALAAAGVRYVIADKAVDSPSMSQVEQMMIPNIGEHRIYELKNVNVGSYSPTDIVRVADTAEAVEAMLARDFDFQRSAVVAEADGRDSRLARLVVADTSNFAMGRHGYILTAKTNAASLIVLPIAFSNCLIATDKRLAPASKIMRIDGALTGVLFSGTIDVRIRPATPFFERPFCNIQDWLAFKNLGPKFSNLWGD